MCNTLSRHVMTHRKHRGKGVARHAHRCHHSGVCTENGSGMPHRPLAKSTCHEGRSDEEAMSMEKGKHRQAQRSSPRRYTCQNMPRRTEESLRGHGCQGQFQGVRGEQFCVRKTDLKMRPLLWCAEGTALSSEATGDGAPQYKKWALPLLAPLPTACTNFSMHAQRL